MFVSVIVPYTEAGDLILKTADSIRQQQGVSTDSVALLVIDITPESDAAQRLSAYHNVRVIQRTDARNEAEAYNIALENLTSDYAVFARPGDVFDNRFFQEAHQALGGEAPCVFAAPRRFCINPVYARKATVSRINFAKAYRNRVADIHERPTLLQIEIDGNVIRSDVLRQYPADTGLKFEYFHDIMIRLQDDYPTYFAMKDAIYSSFMPLSDDSEYFVPSNHIEWYKQSIDEFLLPLITRETERYGGQLPPYIQYYLMYAIAARFLANMNNRNKHNMNEEELQEFFAACKKVLAHVDDAIAAIIDELDKMY